MHLPPTVIEWKITCHSSERAEALQQWLASRIDLERVWTDTVRVMPDAVEQVRVVPHRLGDYFAEIRVLTDAPLPSFRLAFRPQPKAGRFWKDLMVNILQEIEGTSQQASIELAAKEVNVQPGLA